MKTAINLKDAIIAAQACICMALYVTGTITTLPHSERGIKIAMGILNGSCMTHFIVLLCWLAFALQL